VLPFIRITIIHKSEIIRQQDKNIFWRIIQTRIKNKAETLRIHRTGHGTVHQSSFLYDPFHGFLSGDFSLRKIFGCPLYAWHFVFIMDKYLTWRGLFEWLPNEVEFLLSLNPWPVDIAHLDGIMLCREVVVQRCYLCCLPCDIYPIPNVKTNNNNLINNNNKINNSK
jgi:hypothetical protein